MTSEGKHPERTSDMPESAADQKVRVAFIGTGAVTAYHHLPGLRLDPRAELVAVCDTEPKSSERRRVARWNVAHATTDPRGLVPARFGRRGRDRHTQRHAPADRRRGCQGRQTCHVREATGIERARGPPDVRGRP